tara:strand:+ start:21099 stop:21893 length:795 start_codon:yes stop_codon:yes gene_type:complete
MRKRYNDTICKNCSSIGHTYRDCPLPVMSFGIICYRITHDDEIEYLMIQRKNSLAFMEFLKGKYDIEKEEYLQKLINNMTQEEKFFLCGKDFDTIWQEVWLEASNKNIKEYFESKENFNKLLKNNKLNTLIKNSINLNIQPEWGFPKGRRKIKESDLDCSIREFFEETQLTKDDIEIENKDKKFNEIFYGTNGVLYKHSYFLAKIKKNDIVLSINKEVIHQVREIRDLKWCNYEKVLRNIGNHNIERFELFKSIHNKIIIKNKQ